MRNLVWLAGVMVLAGVCLTACGEPQKPVANNKNVLTLEQYKQLQTKISAAQKNSTASMDVKSSSFEEGTAYLRQEQYQQAASSFEQVVQKEPNNSRAWYLLGTCYEKNNQIDRAQLAYKTSYDLLVKQGYIPSNSAL